MTDATVGRRERKKARTRQAIADAALDLFLERGFDQVTVKDVAEAADVSMSGLFKHFPTKESLAFDEDDDVRAGIVSAVRSRPEGTPVLEALRTWLRDHLCDRSTSPRAAVFQELVARTPALNEYARQMWLRHEQALAEAIYEEGPDAPGADIAARTVARFVLDRTQPWHCEDLDAAFTLLAEGWPAPELRARADHARNDPTPTPPAHPPGLRERKKAQTRRAITQAALDLFTTRGYDEVGVREIADAAGTSIATLFTYFPDGKASLVFPGDQADRAAALIDVVRHRSPDQNIVRALHDHMAQRGPFKPDLTPDEQRVIDLAHATPALSDYALRAWTAAQPSLAAAITQEAGLAADDVTTRLLTHYILQIPDLARAATDPRQALDVITNLLDKGWPTSLTNDHP
ncbi:hypothetical protein GCM10022254_32430 [Actinomadura meridiana]|uniref:HTH tetR-type domain-containing protein n=1 Tax=Actinomadura meridiana TaxID=559626 RepID=A0ABP8C2P3_9ACTN